MPITSAVGHADGQAILDEVGQPLLDELGRVIYDADGFGGFGWASGVSPVFASGVGAAAGTAAASARATLTSAAVGLATGTGASSAIGITNVTSAVGLATGSGVAAATAQPPATVPVTTSTFSGTRLFIGGTGSYSISPDSAPWIEVGNIFHLGDFGAVDFDRVTLEAVGDGYTRKIKGLAFAPVLELVLNQDGADAGQDAMLLANADRTMFAYYNFKIEEGSTRTFFTGQVYGFDVAAGSVNDIQKIDTSIEVNPSSIIVVGG